MRLRTLLAAAAVWMAGAASASAETAVLVQGYLGTAGSWRNTGVAAVLRQGGWSDGGHMSLGPRGPYQALPGEPGARRFVTVDLPTEAPIALQARIISDYVGTIRNGARDDRIVLVGHSAGGVAARMAMVVNPALKVDGLVTIASPHMGTEAAEVGSFVANTPLSWVAPFVGLGTVNRSRVLYRDLSREGPYNVLGWINRTPHPKAKYVSIVRVARGSRPDLGDSWVRGYSQDMNVVPALHGSARTVFSPGDHGLRPDDGALLADILRGMSQG